jgi:hypothetical protein
MRVFLEEQSENPYEMQKSSHEPIRYNKVAFHINTSINLSCFSAIYLLRHSLDKDAFLIKHCSFKVYRDCFHTCLLYIHLKVMDSMEGS